ncbi:MAG: hypothetical protein ACOH17_10945 [Cellulomonas sp.]
MRKLTAALGSGLFLTALLPLPAAASAQAPLAAQAPVAARAPVATVTGSACPGGSGVSVVVDFSDLGGDVTIGCATGDPSTGREALIGAGFTATDSTPGMICAISSAPDPCPTTFDGSYWSYWSAQPGTAWVASTVGADSSDPAPGAFEGWRYNDGATGPSLLPAAIQAASATAASAPTSQATLTAIAAAAPAGAGDDGTSWISTTAISVVVVLLVGAAAQVARRRRAAPAAAGDEGNDDEPAGGPQR